MRRKARAQHEFGQPCCAACSRMLYHERQALELGRVQELGWSARLAIPELSCYTFETAAMICTPVCSLDSMNISGMERHNIMVSSNIVSEFNIFIKAAIAKWYN